VTSLSRLSRLQRLTLVLFLIPLANGLIRVTTGYAPLPRPVQIVLIVLDQTNRLSYTNAGHLAPILIRQGEVLRLESNGTVVGMFPDYPYEQCDVELQRGDLLVAFTDGITESENAKEEQFGDERLIELLRRNAERPLEEILGKVMESVGSWAHDPSTRDDITMLLARKL
jgi:sigma-B regulation protein RsbU (phosphoserine phosphatase)